eukprot:1295927-Pleurochrysis_carterae.AAC.1
MARDDNGAHDNKNNHVFQATQTSKRDTHAEMRAEKTRPSRRPLRHRRYKSGRISGRGSNWKG